MQQTCNKKIPTILRLQGFHIDKYLKLLIQSLSYVNGASYGATYHGVVTDAEEAHHLYVSRY